ncbi:MAG: ABC transporter ATP-binding protein [Pyrinomonadaceae bacterium]
MSAISVQNVTKVYPPPFLRLRRFFRAKTKEAVEALRGVSFEVEEREIFGLIGKNGAGKTTVTKIIATLVQPTSGSVRVNGFDSVRNDVKVRSLIGLATAEERSFYWRLTCSQNLLFFARLYGMDDRTAKFRINELYEQLDLKDLANRRFSDLSTGNKQRLAVARALIAKPPILLLDEPTRSLDPLAAASMRALIESIADVSILLTSHNLSEIEQLCKRVAVISHGKIRAVDTPAQLRRAHKEKQEVTITFRGNSKDRLQEFAGLDGFNFEHFGDAFILSFERDANDNLLSETFKRLDEAGAVILDVETKKATLLDVLESYQDKK